MLYGPWPGRFDFHSPAMYCADIGSMREDGMIFPGNGCRVTVRPSADVSVLNGSYIVRSPPTALSDCEKLPWRSKSLGKVLMKSLGSVLRHCSYEKKLNSLFFLMGLPSVPPHM